MTYDEVFAATTSGDLTDYHIATQLEAYEFFHLSGGTGVDEVGPQILSFSLTGAIPSIFGEALSGFILGFFISDEKDIGFISPSSSKIILNDSYVSFAEANVSNPTLRTWILVANSNVAVVPVPAAFWLMGTGILGLIGMSHKKIILGNVT